MNTSGLSILSTDLPLGSFKLHHVSSNHYLATQIILHFKETSLKPVESSLTLLEWFQTGWTTRATGLCLQLAIALNDIPLPRDHWRHIGSAICQYGVKFKFKVI
jgi:hypothetical protein